VNRRLIFMLVYMALVWALLVGLFYAVRP